MSQALLQIHESETEYRNAVMKRDASYDGQFVYGVTSTGIFCRPSCPSRRPAPDNIRIFTTVTEAEDEGFRACMRCSPAKGQSWRKDFEVVREVCMLLESGESTRTKWTLQSLGEHVKLSPAHLQRTFKQVLGISPKEYEEAVRMRAFRAFVKEAPVKVAARLAGLSSVSRLYGSSDYLGMMPGEYKSGGERRNISFAVLTSPLGYLLVAATTLGVCSVKLGDEAHLLVSELRLEFPNSLLDNSSHTLAPYLAAILDSLFTHRDLATLPLDVGGTAFQWRVWKALQEIPPGETRTYGQIAAAIGQPNAARAVGNACGRNPVALAVPCHRAVYPNNREHRYRWGADRKSALLKAEREHADSDGSTK